MSEDRESRFRPGDAHPELVLICGLGRKEVLKRVILALMGGRERLGRPDVPRADIDVACAWADRAMLDAMMVGMVIVGTAELDVDDGEVLFRATEKGLRLLEERDRFNRDHGPPPPPGPCPPG